MTLTREATWVVRVRDVVPRFLATFVPLFLVAGGIVCWGYWSEHRQSRAVLEINERDHVRLQAQIIVGDFKSVVADLRMLARGRTLRQYLDATDPTLLDSLVDEFREFAEQKGVYDQVRYLNAHGEEVVRINLNKGQAQVVPPEELRPKRDRYYFKDTLRLRPGDVFVSPFDLNVEGDQIEQPLKPTVRFGTPVQDLEGRKRGIVILNYLGGTLIEKLRQASVNAADQVMLLNPEGYWLKGAYADDEWGFMYPNRKSRTMEKQHPEAWRRITAADGGQFELDRALFTFQTVFPLAEAQSARSTVGAPADEPLPRPAGRTYHWKVVSLVRPHVLVQRSRRISTGLLPTLAGLASALTLACWFLAKAGIQRKRAVAALRDSEGRFRQLAETIDEVFWMSNVDGSEFIYVSPAYETIWRKSLSQLYAHPGDWLEAIHAEDRQDRNRAFAGVSTQGGFDVEYRLQRGDGSTRWIWERGFAVRDEAGQVYRIAGIAEDITMLRRAQEDTLRSERLAAIGEAMTGLAHESRNALQRSQSGLEMLQRRVKDQPEAAELLREVQQAQYYLRDLYEEVRDYAAPLHLRCREVNVHELLREVWNHLALSRNGREVHFQDDPRGVDTSCWSDPLTIQQVLRNILENALAAAPDPARIDVSWREAVHEGQRALRIAIRDNGPGLSGEQREHLFDPFFTTKSRGTGLGLAISRRIVEAHRGLIEASLDAGSGTEIVVTLPRGKS